MRTAGFFQLIVPIRSFSVKRFSARSIEALRTQFSNWVRDEKIKPTDVPTSMEVHFDEAQVGFMDFAGVYTTRGSTGPAR